METSNIRAQTVVMDANDVTTMPINYDNCQECKNVEIDCQHLQGLGRFLNLSATVRKVCPNKRIAIGMALYETTGGSRVIKGYKTFVAHHCENCCADITLNNIHFILPEEIAETEDPTSTCPYRCFEMDFATHYIDLACSQE